MKISKKVSCVTPSLARQLFNMVQEYTDTIDLTLGDPDMDVPEAIKKAAIDAICSNKTHYSANAGLISARAAAASKINREQGNNFYDESNIIITVGGMEALYLLFLCTVDPGDEVIVFAPYYNNYVQMVNMCEGVPVILDAYGENGFEIDEAVLESSITDRTIAIVINSPNNPTGEVMSKESLRVVAEVAQRHNLLVISDEVYKTLVFDEEYTGISEFMADRKQLVIVDSMSKEYNMTGWRIGYACADSELVAAMTKMQENIVACAPLPSQYAMIAAYDNPPDKETTVSEFKKRRNLIAEGINEIEGLSCIPPKATFYAFVNIGELGMSSVDFAYKLLEKKHVAVVPGVCYGANYDNYIRIAFTKDCSVLREAIDRIKEFAEEIKKK